MSYTVDQLEGGWIWTVPSGRVVLRAGILGRALARLLLGDEVVVASLLGL